MKTYQHFKFDFKKKGEGGCNSPGPECPNRLCKG